MWTHEHRDKLEGYRAYRDATGEDADDVKGAPRLSQFVTDIWEAWGCLSGSRQFTMGGPAPVSISEILAFVRYHHIDDDDARYRLLKLITAMDQTYLEQANKKEQ